MDLLILPFDHRGSLLKKLFGIADREPTEDEKKEVTALKKMVFHGFRKALDKDVPKQIAGILVDEEFGREILSRAKKDGIITAMPTEKSGQNEFDFEYEDYEKHIAAIDPTYVKVLVRFNPAPENSAANKTQLARLKKLDGFLKKTKRKLIFELLVPATKTQLAAGQEAYDLNARPKLMVEAMKAIQDYGVEPDVWKLEGVSKQEDSTALVRQAQSNGRKAGIITLGRGENADKVREWLKVGAKIDGVIGFAVGRTVFWDAMKAMHEKKISEEEAAEQVANNYKQFVDLWMSERVK